MADFEQDRHYNDLDGNLKTFTIRDYSKAKPIMDNRIPTEESKTAAQKLYEESTWTVVDELIEENPAMFAREYEEAISIYDGKIEWNRNALFLIARDYPSWSRLKNMLSTAILEHLGYREVPANFLDVIASFRNKYKTVGEI